MTFIDDVEKAFEGDEERHALHVAHYYGDTVRKLMLAAALAILVGAPFYTDVPGQSLTLIVFSALILVCFAAFTTPFSRMMMTANTVAAGTGMVLFAAWALMAYGEVPVSMVIIREGIALIFFFALYFAGKSLRHMNLRLRSREEREEAAKLPADGSASPTSDEDLAEDYEYKDD